MSGSIFKVIDVYEYEISDISNPLSAYITPEIRAVFVSSSISCRLFPPSIRSVYPVDCRVESADTPVHAFGLTYVIDVYAGVVPNPLLEPIQPLADSLPIRASISHTG